MLLPEELYFTLPPTHAVWDGDGLNIFQERYALEPPHRARKSMFDMITENTSTVSSSNYPMLIEDVQLCMCALQSSIWRLYHTAEHKDRDVNLVLERDFLRRILHALMERLDHMAIQNAVDAAFDQEPSLLLRNYFGYEDHSLFGWQSIVSARTRSLHCDAVMLSYLLDLHLLADIASLSQLAKGQTLTPIQEQSSRFRDAHAQRQSSAHSWADSSIGRQALCTAVDILIEHQNIARERVPGLEKHKMDPIAHIATSVAALVVWGYCKYSKYSCASCAHNHTQGVDRHTIELGNCPRRKDLQQQSSRQMWIENDGGTRLNLQGVAICACNVGHASALFLACLPDGWEVADKIATSVFHR